MKHALTAVAILAGYCLVASPGQASTAEAQFCQVENFRVGTGETTTGDRYMFATSVAIAGRHEGDLITFSNSASVSGEVTGDMWTFAGSTNIGGTVGDSVRCFSQTVIVDGTIEGDLVVFAQQLILRDSGRIRGNLRALVATSQIEGTIEGHATITGGEVSFGGTALQDVEITADTLNLDPESRIAGDLRYETRKELDLDGSGIVAGTISYEQPTVDDHDGEDDDSFVTRGDVLWWLFRTGSSMLIGLLLVGLFRRFVAPLIAPIDREALIGSLIGLITALIVPIAAIVAMVAVVTIPLSVVVLTLFAVAVYLAKLPVAAWLGQWLLKTAGQAAPSPYLSIAVGILGLYLAYEIPYLGKLIWMIVICLGIGTTILATRERMQSSET